MNSAAKNDEHVPATLLHSPSHDARLSDARSGSASDLTQANSVSPAGSPRQHPRTLADEPATEINLSPPAVDHALPFNSPREGDNPRSLFDAEKGHVNPDAHRLEHGIYWRSPFMMASTTILGIGACLSHHFFYMSLRSKPADADAQQRYLR
jgi:hypothetical protein